MVISDKFYKNYENVLDCPDEPFNINSFQQIGMADPFPTENKVNFEIPRAHTDMVYGQSRYRKDNSPHTLYIPSRKLLFKIMRACIGVDQVKDLWFNKEKYKI